MKHKLCNISGCRNSATKRLGRLDVCDDCRKVLTRRNAPGGSRNRAKAVLGCKPVVFLPNFPFQTYKEFWLPIN